MKKLMLLSALSVAALMQSCLNNDDGVNYVMPTAVVTVYPQTDGSFIMNLDSETTLLPVNMKKSPFGDKEVRALVNYSEADEMYVKSGAVRDVYVNVHQIDSIRTKMPVDNAGEDNDKLYGNDPIEIVRDWVTVAEDGYLTLRVRTLWGYDGVKHNINLLRCGYDNSTFEFELRHDACGDVRGTWGDALIAFNLKELMLINTMEAKIKLKWQSFTGEKSVEFSLRELISGPERPSVSGVSYSAAVD